MRLALLCLLMLSGCTSAETEYRAGDEFQDCDTCPAMIVIPAGNFVMGSPASETGRLSHEGPQHTVEFARPFAIGKYEVTFAEWNACVLAGGCNFLPPDEGWGRGTRPVINLNMDQMNAYLHWLTLETGHIYRLPTEAEWEYAARAGSTAAFHWGDNASHAHANFGAEECCSEIGRAHV